MFCKNCGTKLSETASFCTKCGTKVKDEVAQTGVSSNIESSVGLKKKKSFFSGLEWIAWWIVNQNEVVEQVRNYDSLGLFKSARKIAALLLLFSAAISTLIIFLNTSGVDPYSFIDVGIFIFLAIFVFQGQKWAIIGAMIVWTIEKALLLFPNEDGSFSGSPLWQIIWWAVYMHAFYLSFKVERAKDKLSLHRVLGG